MNRVWLVTKHHFLQEATKKSFLLVLFALPLFMGVTIGFGLLVSTLKSESAVVGYVDQAGLIQETIPPPEGEDVELVAFGDRNEARAALDSEEIDAYYVVPSSYDHTGRVTLYYNEEPPPGVAHRYFLDTARYNLMASQSEVLTDRVMERAEITVRSVENNRSYPADGPSAGHFTPLIAAAILTFLVVTTSSYMAEVVSDEKANRTIEIVITSISSAKMMAGKILGALLIAALQLAVWLLCLGAFLWLGANVLDWSWLDNPQVIWRDVLLVVLVGVPTYIFISSLITLIGSTMADANDAQQIGALSMLIMFLPLYLMPIMINDTDGAVARIFSLLPGPSVVTLAMRSLFQDVPTVQFLLAAAAAVLGSVLALWLAGKAFRLSMLRTGQRLRLAEVFRKG